MEVTERWSRTLYPRLRDEDGNVLPAHLQKRFVDWYMSNGYFKTHKERITGTLGPEAALWVQDGYPQAKAHDGELPAQQIDPAPPQQPRAPSAGEQDPRWGLVLDELRGVLTPGNYERWLLPTWVHRDSGASLVIAAPSDFICVWLDTKLRHKVEVAAARVLDPVPAITFVTDVQ